MNRALKLLLVMLFFPWEDAALATEQELDTIGTDFLLDRPLNDYIRTLNPMPKFDVRRTSNYKGYEASWEIRDSRLFLTSFAAATNRAPQPVSVLFPTRELPILADWFSGPLHVIGGKTSLSRGYQTFERVTRYQVSKGIITATKELRNVREDKLKNQQ
jgi:hypothetical protein